MAGDLRQRVAVAGCTAGRGIMSGECRPEISGRTITSEREIRVRVSSVQEDVTGAEKSKSAPSACGGVTTMTISSRTPEGEPAVCPICDAAFTAEPSQPGGDAPCPCCGHLVWFDRDTAAEVRPPYAVSPPRWSLHVGAGTTSPAGGDEPAKRELAVHGRVREGFINVADTVQSVSGYALACGMFSTFIMVALWPGSPMGRVCVKLYAIATVVMFIVFIYSRLASLIARLWGWRVRGVATAGSSFGGVWDRELDG